MTGRPFAKTVLAALTVVALYAGSLVLVAGATLVCLMAASHTVSSPPSAPSHAVSARAGDLEFVGREAAYFPAEPAPAD